MEQDNKKGGMGFLAVLTLIFITLKLVGVIEWPWLWVLAPIWGVAVLAVAIVVVYLILAKITKS